MLATPKPSEGGRLRSNELQPRTVSGLPLHFGKTTKGNQGNQESLGKPKVQIMVFFAAFCKDLYCIAGATPATTVRRTCLSAVCFMSRLGLDRGWGCSVASLLGQVGGQAAGRNMATARGTRE